MLNSFLLSSRLDGGGVFRLLLLLLEVLKLLLGEIGISSIFSRSSERLPESCLWSLVDGKMLDDACEVEDGAGRLAQEVRGW